MGAGIPGFEFQLTANRLGTGLTFLESKDVQPAQLGLLSSRLLGAQLASSQPRAASSWEERGVVAPGMGGGNSWEERESWPGDGRCWGSSRRALGSVPSGRP